jgi:hypothetical protein
MPLYIEIVDQDSSFTESAIQGIDETGVLESWTSATTGEVVRLVDVPESHRALELRSALELRNAPRAAARGARILFS